MCLLIIEKIKLNADTQANGHNIMTTVAFNQRLALKVSQNYTYNILNYAYFYLHTSQWLKRGGD